MTLQVTRISAAADLLGESPVWDGERQVLYWVDGVSRRVHSHDPVSGATRDWQVLLLSGAKHSFTDPGADGLGMTEVGYNATADKRSWAAMRALLAEDSNPDVAVRTACPAVEGDDR